MKVFCILSDERAFRSKSPAMHNAVMKKLGMSGVYVPFQVEAERIGEAVAGLRALNIAGANVTVPYKEAVMGYLDHISEEAAAIGAINTIFLQDNKLGGYNTDADGFIDALESAGISPEGRDALVFGAGGAAKAAVAALKRLNARSIVVAGRNKADVSALSGRFGAKPMPIDDLKTQEPAVHLVVNATSVSSPQESPELADLALGLKLSTCEAVVDLNYGRKENFWKSAALARDARFMDGLPMLAYQARRSFMLWTGLDVEPAWYLDALKESL